MNFNPKSFFCIFLLCHSSILMAEESQSDYFIYPTGKIRPDFAASTWGGAFGALGVLLENALEDTDKPKNTIETLLSPEQQVRLATKLAEKLNDCSITTKINKEVLQKENPFWFKEENSIAVNDPNFKSAKKVIEVGLILVAASKNIGKDSLNGYARLRIYDANTAKHIKTIGEYNGVSQTVYLEHFNNGSPEMMSELSNKLDNVINYVAKNYSEKICGAK